MKNVLTPFQCLLVGSELNRDNRLTDNVMSGLVHCAKYIRAPITFRYGTLGPSIRSSSSLRRNESF